VTCVNVEHEEVCLVPRWLDVGRVTFKYGLSDDFIDVLKVIRRLGLDATERVTVGSVEVAPRDVVAACLPDPAELGHLMHGVTCAGTWVKGTATGGARREAYLFHAVDNEWSMTEYDTQAVVWQAALNPVLALELLASGSWSGVGLLGPEALPSAPFLDLLSESGAPWYLEERTPS
jgi:saccharopine dehydrogenase-like NADP-dependent oxidoreductase